MKMLFSEFLTPRAVQSGKSPPYPGGTLGGSFDRLITFGEAKCVHCQSMNERDCVLGNDFVEELYE